MPDVAGIVERLDAVEQLLCRLIEGSATEVRTRGLVVREDDGFERIVLAAHDDHGLVTVTARGAGDSCAAELYAHDQGDGDDATAGVAVVLRGDVLADLGVDGAGRARLAADQA